MPPKPVAKGALKKPGQGILNKKQGKLKRGDSKQDLNGAGEMIKDDDSEFMNEGKKDERIILTDKELNEDMPSKVLMPSNPQAPRNIAYYDYLNRKYLVKSEDNVDQLIIHFQQDGELIHKESNEAKTQEEIQETRTNLINEAIRAAEQEEPGVPKDLQAIKQTLRNKFNYNVRECQTSNPIIRARGVGTEPPPSDTIRGETTQWDIFDSYMIEFQKEQEKKKEESSESTLYSVTFKRSLKIMERMVVQNDQKEKYHDYKYYWNQGDALPFNKNEGHLLPIWRFSNEKQRKKNVTCITWNPKYADLFAIGLGSYDFLRQRTGLICVYSLKNTTHPEYTYTCESGVMCLDFHPESPALICVGLYDGSVLVYDVRNKHKKPIYQSNVRTSKHTDPVWQVKWNPDVSKNYNFYSISSDGRVMNWVLMKNKLEPEEVIRLRLVGKNDEESTLIGLACGLCFDFNIFEPHIFLVGTEEGKIHKCSRAYSGQYQETYTGHLLAVYKVKWNNYHSRTFISASADWTVRVWDSRFSQQVMCFDLSMQIVDAVWSPHSSTIFSCATLDKVYVYDLSIDKHSKLADQKPVKQPKLTNLCFNPRDPVILVGDTHGGVTLLKLSPNLSRATPIDQRPKDFEGTSIAEFEKAKMENLLQLAAKWERDDLQ